MTRFYFVIFSCLVCFSSAYSSFFDTFDKIEMGHVLARDEDEDIFGNDFLESPTTPTSLDSDEDEDIFGDESPESKKKSLKKKTPYQFTPKMARRIRGLSGTYSLDTKKSTLLHWTNKALSRGRRKRARSIEQFFHKSEIAKMVRQGVDLEELLMKIKILKSVCRSPLKPIQGNHQKKRKGSPVPVSLVFSPAKRLFVESRRDTSPSITTQGRDRIYLAPRKLNFSFGESLLDKLPEVPKENRLNGPRTRGLEKKEFTQYLNGSSNLQKYEKRLWKSHRDFILQSKKNHYRNKGHYPTVPMVQQTFLNHVAPHMMHLKILGYDVYFDLKILRGRNSKEKNKNLDLLNRGFSPLGPDGEPMEIHHLTQRGPGEAKRSRIILAFLSKTLHGESEVNSFKDRQAFHFSKRKLFRKKNYASIDRTLFGQHRQKILEAVYGVLNT